MNAVRSLIVNADDFGQSVGVNHGIVEAHERGIVTSASMMVRWPAANAAAAYMHAHPSLSVGLHIDLGEWIYRGGDWEPIYEVVPLIDASVVSNEVMAQLAIFRQLTGQNPTHIDSHQHVHRHEPVYSILVHVARALNIPLRHYAPGIHYCGDFYGQTATGEAIPAATSVDNLINILVSLPAGFTELACHPGLGTDLDSMYSGEREAEVKALTDPRVADIIIAQAINLGSFHDIAPKEGRPITVDQAGQDERVDG